MRRKNRKPLFAAIAAFSVFIIGGSIAYFTSSVDFENIFKTATYKTITSEVFEAPSNWAPGQTIPKTITTYNDGSISAAVRVSMTQEWVTQTGARVANAPSDAVIINLINQADWTYSSGYYYYNTFLEPGKRTTSLMSSVTLNPELNGVVCTTSADGHTKTCEAKNGVAGNIFKLKISTETVQADRYGEVWGATGVVINDPAYAFSINGDNLSVRDIDMTIAKIDENAAVFYFSYTAGGNTLTVSVPASIKDGEKIIGEASSLNAESFKIINKSGVAFEEEFHNFIENKSLEELTNLIRR